MITLSNSLSFVRVPLAFLFLQENPTWRFAAILLAMITDSIDGYLARRSQSVTKFGTILDPAVDKFFVYFAMLIFFMEGRIASWEAVAMLSRDFFVCLYGILMVATGRWSQIVFRAIRWGKVTTALQFIVLSSLTFGFFSPWYIFAAFVVMGWMAFLELFRIVETKSPA